MPRSEHDGADAGELLREATELLFEHSLFTGHPRFLAYVIGAPSPLGALADLLASAVNPNLGGFPLSPVATEIERQTVRWLAELIGYRPDCGGLLVSGGNMANFIGFLAARRAQADWDVRGRGLGPPGRCASTAPARPTPGCSKAADMFGLGTDAIHWVPTDAELRLDPAALRKAVRADREAGEHPFLVIATAGSVSTGAIDPIRELADDLPRRGALAARRRGLRRAARPCCRSAHPDLKALARGRLGRTRPTQVALHAGGGRVRARPHSRRPPRHLRLLAAATTSFRRTSSHYYKRGPQNTRGFRALKVWLGLRHLGRAGYAT